MAKPGLDGHSNGAEQIAVAARDAGMEVVYSGIRLTPEQIAASARDEDPDVIGLSVLSGSHRQLVPEVLDRLAAEGVDRARRAAGRRVRDRQPPAGHHRARPGAAARPASGPGRSGEVFGEFRAPTGVRAAAGGRSDELAAVAHQGQGACRAVHPACSWPSPAWTGTPTAPSRSPWPPRDAGMEVVYSGIRLTPEQIAASARDEDPDVIGLSVLSGSHRQLVPEVLDRLAAEGVDAVVVVGGIIPEEDRDELLAAGVRAVYTPKDFELGRIMDEITGFTEERRAAV